MKKALAILSLSLLSLPAAAVDLTLKQKLFVAEGATALVAGAPMLLVATVTGRKEELCHLLEGAWVKPSSYNPNSNGEDQCPKGNWLRAIPFLAEHIKD